MNSKKLNVAFFVPSLDGGIGHVTMLLASGLQANGKKVEIWSATPKKYDSKESKNNLKIRYIGTGSVSSAFLPLLRELKIHTPITIISASFHANCLTLIASIFSSSLIKFVITDHPSIDSSLKEFSFIKRLLWRILIFILYPLADKHVAVSKGVANAMSKYGGIELSKISIIPNPVINENMFKQSSAFVYHSFFKINEPIFLYVGRLSYEKDVANIINAFSKVQKQVPSRLIIVGEGPDRNKLEDIVNQSNIIERVSFLGHQENPYPFFVKSDLFLLSSTREGLPTVLIEALAFGLKIVSTDCPSGPSEILNKGKYGKLVKVGDCSAFANSIISSLKTTRPKVPKSFIKKYNVKSVVNLYSKIVS